MKWWNNISILDTYGIQPRSCRSGTHRGAEEHRSCEVPVFGQFGCMCSVHRNETHEFDSNLLVVEEVGTLKDDTKRSLSDFLAHAVVDTHYV